MRIAVAGEDGPLARAARRLLESRGHRVEDPDPDAVIYFPGSASGFERVAAASPAARLVLRSHACAYGSSTKNPGFLTEQRASLLPAAAPERRWLELEAVAARRPDSAAVRLANVLHPGEGDLVVRQLGLKAAVALAGHDPNLQFMTLEDAAAALVAAAESRATGLFNAAAPDAVPLKAAFRAAGTRRLPLPAPLARLSRWGRAMDQLQYNWTVSSERARRELGWQASQSSTDALAGFLSSKPGSRSLSRPAYDPWGLDPDYIRAWGAWFWFLRHVYWRIEHEGLDHIPDSGRGLFVANHRGFMPLDAVMHLSLISTYRRRIPRFLIIHSLLKFPFLCNFLTKLGGVIASQENAARLFADENLVGIFPEGIRGAFTPYSHTYGLRDFTRSGFARIAVENQAPVIPAAVVGHAEIFPIIGRVDWSYLTREWGWPYLPIAPPFPLAPIPLPSKWHVRVLAPAPLQGLKPADAADGRLMREYSRHIQQIVQHHIDEMLARRKHIFWGRLASSPQTGASGSRAGASSAAGEVR